MADEVTKTVENVDRLFAQIVVNGEVHESQNYVPQQEEQIISPQITEESSSDPATPVPAPTTEYGEDIHAVSINDVLHDFVDPETVQNLSQEVTARQTADGLLQQGINGLTGQVHDIAEDVGTIQSSVSTIQSKIPNQASSENQLADKDFVDTSIEQAIAEAGSGIEVYPTEEAIIQDLPNLDDDDIVATYGDDHAVNDVPLGSIVAYWGTTDPVDKKWLVLDGRDTTGTDIELQTHYPSLYLHLGGKNVLPDLRECVPVGIGQNGTDTIATHDIYTLGQFKDDQLQTHDHYGMYNNYPNGIYYMQEGSNGTANTSYARNARTGDTTHGKQKGVNWIIKAVSTADVTPLPSESIQEIEGYVEEYVNGNSYRYSDSEKQVGTYYGKPLYMITVEVEMNGTSINQNVTKTLDSAFSNYIVVRLQATCERANFSVISCENKYVSAWLSTRTTLNIEQGLSSNTSDMKVLVDLFYVKS